MTDDKSSDTDADEDGAGDEYTYYVDGPALAVGPGRPWRSVRARTGGMVPRT